jgi:hypothetical protein
LFTNYCWGHFVGTEIKVWQLIDNQLSEIGEANLAAAHLERELEGWIEKNTSLLGANLLVIARQLDVPGVGCLDLLCIDESGTLVIIELKRDSTSREAVAQILDYASWLNTTTEAEVDAYAQSRLGKSLSEAFEEHFGNEWQPLSPQNHRLLLVAPKLDLSAERIINYLADRSRVNINAVFFRYVKTRNNEEILVRTVLVPDELAPRSRPAAPSLIALLRMAEDRKILPVVKICRELSKDASYEEPAVAYEGSLRYWYRRGASNRMILGVNISGGRRRSPPPNPGELDVWIPAPRLAEVVSISEAEIRNTLHDRFAASDAGATDCIVRLKDPEQAHTLILLLREWIRRPPPTGVTEEEPSRSPPGDSSSGT